MKKTFSFKNHQKILNKALLQKSFFFNFLMCKNSFFLDLFSNTLNPNHISISAAELAALVLKMLQISNQRLKIPTPAQGRPSFLFFLGGVIRVFKGMGRLN